MATRGTIPAKKAGKKAAKKVATKRKVRAQAGKAQAKVDFVAGGRDPKVSEVWGAALVLDAIEGEILPHARLRKMARSLLEAAGAVAMVLPDHDDCVLAYGKPTDIVQMLKPAVPRRRFVRDSITGLFIRARDALRRPKTTATETR